MIQTLIPIVVACLVFTLPLQAPTYANAPADRPVLAKAPADRGTVVTGKPEDLGFSPERLARIHDAVQRHIDAKSLAGVVQRRWTSIWCLRLPRSQSVII